MSRRSQRTCEELNSQRFGKEVLALNTESGRRSLRSRRSSKRHTTQSSSKSLSKRARLQFELQTEELVKGQSEVQSPIQHEDLVQSDNM